MKTLLLPYLRPASYRQAIARRHRERLGDRGIRIVCADDEIDGGDAELFHDTLPLPPQEDVALAFDVLLRYARMHTIDGVVAQTEAAILPGALLARELGLGGISVEAAHACVDKGRSRTLLRGAAVPTPAFAFGRAKSDVMAFASRRGFPVVLKAVASSMSRLVTLVRTEQDVDAAVARVRAGLESHPDVMRLESFARAAGVTTSCDPRTTFLVESFAAGDPVETDGIVTSGTPVTFAVTEQVMFPPPRFYIAGYQTPSDRPPVERDRITAVSNAALAASGVDGTGFSIEMRATPEGPVVIEVNGRLGQDDGFSDLFEPISGIEPIVHLIEHAAGLAAPLVARESARRALAYRCSFEDGVVTRVPGAPAFRALAERGLHAGLSVRPGTRVFAPPHPEAYPHLAWAIAADATSSRAAYERAAQAVAALEFEIAPA